MEISAAASNSANQLKATESASTVEAKEKTSPSQAAEVEQATKPVNETPASVVQISPEAQQASNEDRDESEQTDSQPANRAESERSEDTSRKVQDEVFK